MADNSLKQTWMAGPYTSLDNKDGGHFCSKT